MQDQWQALLSDSRVPSDSPGPRLDQDEFRTPFEADYDRVIYSTPFRRLARKTQVHPLALNDHVRTRLTHSLEVACVGRGLAKRLHKFLHAKNHLPPNRDESDIVWIMMAACAAHDIGNPPFGHAGEYAIREWVSTHRTDVYGTHEVAPAVRKDIELFEGNAQSFRIAARRDNTKTGYLRLTYATLGAMIKYPWHSEDPRAAARQKYNVFSTELDIFNPMMRALGLARGGDHSRHPMSFLTEAADDICYRILDLDDAVEIGILGEDRVRDAYDAAIGAHNPAETLPVRRGRVISRLIDGAWSAFEHDYDNIMQGNRTKDLKSDLDQTLSAAIADIQALYIQIFAERSKVATEIGAYKALGRILKTLCTATQHLAHSKNYTQTSFVTQRCLDFAWGRKYATDHQHQPFDWWLHQILDYVSGLTDNYARQVSREIEGV